jgi:hypothetical protein
VTLTYSTIALKHTKTNVITKMHSYGTNEFFGLLDSCSLLQVFQLRSGKITRNVRIYKMWITNPPIPYSITNIQGFSKSSVQFEYIFFILTQPDSRYSSVYITLKAQ